MKLIFWRMSDQNSLITINRIYIKFCGGNTAFTTTPIDGTRPHWKVKFSWEYNVLDMRPHWKVYIKTCDLIGNLSFYRRITFQTCDHIGKFFPSKYNVLDMRPHWKVIFSLKYNVLDIRPHWKVIFSLKYNVSDKCTFQPDHCCHAFSWKITERLQTRPILTFKFQGLQ